jgi:uncharacterized protein involved in exopolysaccharide biosynthesis
MGQQIKSCRLLADIYLDHHLTVYKTPKFDKFVQEQTRLLKNKLQQSEKKLESLKKQHNIISLEEERSLLLNQEAALRADLNRIDVAARNYRLYLTKLEESRISDAMGSEKITSVSLIEPAQLPL